MKASELRSKSAHELVGLSISGRIELARLKFRHTTGQLEKTAEIGKKRKEIARILTVLREKESLKGKNAKAD